MSKVIPVAPRDQAKGKLLHSFGVAGLGLVAASAVIIVAFHPKAAVLAAAIAVGAVGAFFLTVLGMVIDLARPLLTWTNPQKAIKQNLNVLLAVFADLGFFFLLYFFARFLGKAGLSGPTVVAAVFGLLSLLGILSYRMLLRFADKRYPQIE